MGHQVLIGATELQNLVALSGHHYFATNFSHCRQHNSGCLHKQRGWDEVGPIMCPPVENTNLVCQKTCDSQSSTHPRPAEHDSRQAIQTWPNHSNRMVPQSRRFQSNMQLVAPAQSGPFWPPDSTKSSHSLSHQFRTPRHGQWIHSASLGRGWIPMPSHQQPSLAKWWRSCRTTRAAEWYWLARVAQHALVLGPGDHVQSDTTVPAKPAQSGDSDIQPDPSQESVKPEPTCLAPRATAIKEQGFSEAVAARIESPWRRSTRSVYEAKWTIFTKWCLSNQVNLGHHLWKRLLISFCTCFRTGS